MVQIMIHIHSPSKIPAPPVPARRDGATTSLTPQAMDRARGAGRCAEYWLVRGMMVLVASLLVLAIRAELLKMLRLPHLFGG